MKKRGCFFVGLFLLGLAVFLVLVNIPYKRFGNKVVIDKATTVLTGPIRADGGVDYLGAINQRISQGVTLENNAAALLFLLTPQAEFGSSEAEAEILEKKFADALGYKEFPERIDWPDPASTIREKLYSETDDSLERDQIDLRLDAEMKLVQKPWSANDFPHWAEALEQETRALDLAVAASKRSEYYHPLIVSSQGSVRISMMMGSLLPVGQRIRHCALQLRFRAMHSLAKGSDHDVVSAIEDIMAIRRLGVLQSRSPVIIEKLVALAVFRIALEAEECLLASNKLTNEQLLDYQNFLAAHNCHVETAMRLDQSERLMVLETIQNIQIYGKEGLQSFGMYNGMSDVQFTVINFVLGTADLSESMRVTNAWYDRYVASVSQPTLRESRTAIVALDAELMKVADEVTDLKYSGMRMIRGPKSRGSLIGDIASAIWLPAVQQIFDTEIINVIHDEVMGTAFALVRFRNDRNHYPQSLQELVPNYLESVPTDPYNGTSFKYGKNGDGFLLYSIGTDDIDNGGRNYYETEDHREFDVRVCLGPKPVCETGSPLDIEKKLMEDERQVIERDREREQQNRDLQKKLDAARQRNQSAEVDDESPEKDEPRD